MCWNRIFRVYRKIFKQSKWWWRDYELDNFHNSTQKIRTNHMSWWFREPILHDGSPLYPVRVQYRQKTTLLLFHTVFLQFYMQWIQCAERALNSTRTKNTIYYTEVLTRIYWTTRWFHEVKVKHTSARDRNLCCEKVFTKLDINTFCCTTKIAITRCGVIVEKYDLWRY